MDAAPAASGSSSAGPAHQLEIESTFDVDADTPLPDLSGLPGVAGVGAGEVRHLDAAYLDTPDYAIGRSAAALRRRTGGPDAGWHLKISAPEGRHEYQWPLDAGVGAEGGGLPAVPPAVPPAVLDGVVAHIGIDPTEPLASIARIVNERHAYALTDASGSLVAEFTDDHVSATDVRRDVVTEWREWEFELGPAAPADADGRAALLAAAERACFAAGARPPASGSKLQRALGR